ncbi:unnamed protein product [Camellia sinensis]
MFFGLDYDLDLFNIVAVSDFNIFNSKVVLASPETATDADYDAILGIIGHKAAAKVNDVLARAEEQEQMIESLHTSRTADLISLHSEKNQEIEKAFIDLEMKSQCDEKMSDFVFCKTRTSSTKI